MYKYFFKRLLGFCIALTALLCIWWFLAIITIWLHYANKGAGAFFLQDRIGKDGKIFKIIKFKTMTDEKGSDGLLIPDDQRLTKVGKFVRSTSIDELPQLINILKGDMSLIGPRPLTPAYLKVYSPRQARRMEARPGISGWAQVHERQRCRLSKKFEYDVWYVDHCSIWLDIKIIFMTIANVLWQKNIGEGSNNFEEFDDLGFLEKFKEMKDKGDI